MTNWTEHDWPKHSALTGLEQSPERYYARHVDTDYRPNKLPRWKCKSYVINSTEGVLWLSQHEHTVTAIMLPPLDTTESVSTSVTPCAKACTLTSSGPSLHRVGGITKTESGWTGWESWSIADHRHTASSRLEFLNSMCNQLAEKVALLSQLLTKRLNGLGWDSPEVRALIESCEFIQPFS